MTDFQKVLKIPNIMNIHLVGAELFHADRGTDGRTDMTKLVVAFRSFANAPKKGKFPDGCKQNANENFVYKNAYKLSNNMTITL
jgi:hypothetical protein